MDGITYARILMTTVAESIVYTVKKKRLTDRNVLPVKLFRNLEKDILKTRLQIKLLMTFYQIL